MSFGAERVENSVLGRDAVETSTWKRLQVTGCAGRALRRRVGAGDPRSESAVPRAAGARSRGNGGPSSGASASAPSVPACGLPGGTGPVQRIAVSGCGVVTPCDGLARSLVAAGRSHSVSRPRDRRRGIWVREAFSAFWGAPWVGVRKGEKRRGCGESRMLEEPVTQRGSSRPTQRHRRPGHAGGHGSSRLKASGASRPQGRSTGPGPGKTGEWGAPGVPALSLRSRFHLKAGSGVRAAERALPPPRAEGGGDANAWRTPFLYTRPQRGCPRGTRVARWPWRAATRPPPDAVRSPAAGHVVPASTCARTRCGGGSCVAGRCRSEQGEGRRGRRRPEREAWARAWSRGERSALFAGGGPAAKVGPCARGVNGHRGRVRGGSRVWSLARGAATRRILLLGRQLRSPVSGGARAAVS